MFRTAREALGRALVRAGVRLLGEAPEVEEEEPRRPRVAVDLGTPGHHVLDEEGAIVGVSLSEEARRMLEELKPKAPESKAEAPKPPLRGSLRERSMRRTR